MKAEGNDIQGLMLKSLEEPLDSYEQILLEDALGSSAEMRKKYQDLKEVRQLLNTYELDSDSLWSEEEIIRFIPVQKAENQAKTFVLGRYWSRIAAACVIALVISMGSVYFQNGSIDADTLVGIDDIYADEAYTYLNTNYAYDE